jgi:D-glycero-D-manno-heptose 1,7-bisphosphate phosphatase
MAIARYVLLDRDGVINHDSDQFIKSPEEWHPIPGSLEAIALLNQHGFEVAVVSNQSGLARGLFDQATLADIHAKMQQMAGEKGGKISAIYFCPHGPDDGCDCRKPKPGMLKKFASDFHIQLSDLTLIGDSIVDIQVARAVAAKPMLVRTGKGQKTLTENPDLTIPIFDDLYEAVRNIIAKP